MTKKFFSRVYLTLWFKYFASIASKHCALTQGRKPEINVGGDIMASVSEPKNFFLKWGGYPPQI